MYKLFFNIIESEEETLEMGEITTINQAGTKNYFAQMGQDSENTGSESSDEDTEKKEEPLPEENLIKPSIMNEDKKNLKIKMKKNNKKKKKGKRKGKAKYEEQFKKLEGDLFKGRKDMQ